MHVAKSAGTTVRLVAENAFPGDLTYPSGSPLSSGGYFPLRRSTDAGEDLGAFQMLSGHFGSAIGAYLGPNANMFTWLREPGDRAISDFFFFVIQERKATDGPYAERLENGERAETVFLDWLASAAPGLHRQQVQLVYGTRWEPHLAEGLTEAALEALRRCFFIGLLEDQERSLDALCAITSILPPRRTGKRNPGTNRPERLEFTAEEQAVFDAILAPDRAFYALARDIYDRQMAELAERGRSEPALALIGNRAALRRHILSRAEARTPVLTTWNAWDPVLGENLDGRESHALNGVTTRWRWTASSPDTFVHFRLPRCTAFILRIRLAPATPGDHANHVTLRLDDRPVTLRIERSRNGRTTLVAMISRSASERLQELAELHLHTARMLDESTLAPYAGTRKLGLAIEEISATPITFFAGLRHRVEHSPVGALARRFLRRLRRSQ